MTICLVTDRQRRSPVEQAAEAAEAGVELVQVREPGLEAAALAALVVRIVEVTRGTRTRVVVNDRLDVALGCGADGVHLRGDSVPVPRARALAPDGFLIGRSVHGVEDAAAAAGADYVIAGTVFPTASKPGRSEWLGVAGLASVVTAVAVPVLAIGGITPDRVPALRTAGAAGIAAITLFDGRERPIREVVRELRTRFDMSGDSSLPV